MYRYGVLGEEAIEPVNPVGEYPTVLSPTEGAAIWMQDLAASGALVHIGKVARGTMRSFVSLPAALEWRRSKQ